MKHHIFSSLFLITLIVNPVFSSDEKYTEGFGCDGIPEDFSEGVECELIVRDLGKNGSHFIHTKCAQHFPSAKNTTIRFRCKNPYIHANGMRDERNGTLSQIYQKTPIEFESESTSESEFRDENGKENIDENENNWKCSSCIREKWSNEQFPNFRCKVDKGYMERKSEDFTAKKMRMPWTAAVYKNGIYHCEGTLVDTFFILTMAHCLKMAGGEQEWTLNITEFTIVLGLPSSRNVAGVTSLAHLNSSQNEDLQFLKIKEIVIHPNYSYVHNASGKMHHEDVALIQLENEVRVTINVLPVLLPTNLQGRAIDRGHHILYLGGFESRKIISRHFKDCQRLLGFFDKTTQFCANIPDPGDSNLTLSFCQEQGQGNDNKNENGDGNGVFIQDGRIGSRQRWFIQGLFSYKSPSCQKNLTLVMKIQPFVPWITKEINRLDYKAIRERGLKSRPKISVVGEHGPVTSFNGVFIITRLERGFRWYPVHPVHVTCTAPYPTRFLYSTILVLKTGEGQEILRKEDSRVLYSHFDDSATYTFVNKFALTLGIYQQTFNFSCQSVSAGIAGEQLLLLQQTVRVMDLHDGQNQMILNLTTSDDIFPLSRDLQRGNDTNNKTVGVKTREKQDEECSAFFSWERIDGVGFGLDVSPHYSFTCQLPNGTFGSIKTVACQTRDKCRTIFNTFKFSKVKTFSYYE